MNHPLSIRAVHQKLLLRLILMGGAIALLLGAAVWIFQHDRIDTDLNTYFAPEEAVDDALKTLAPGKHPPSHLSEYSTDIA